MNKVELHCKAITPMFMTGADGKSVELRPSEFKGMMRFWWRAIKAEDNLTQLKKEEADIFGGTGEREGKSKVSLRVILEKLNICPYRLLPHKDNKILYPSIRENSEYLVVLASLNDINFYKDIFVISTILGGFGKRSRRGFGSIEVEDLGNNIDLTHICKILNSIKDSYVLKNSKIINTASGEDYPWIKEIEIGKRSSKNVDEILQIIGKASHNHNYDSLGYAKGKDRFASPIYVSVIKDSSNKYFPIITTLNTVFKGKRQELDVEQNKFKEEIL